MKVFFKVILKFLKSAVTIGCVLPLNSSQSRITIFTNIMAYWGFAVFIPLSSILISNGISPRYFIVPYLSTIVANAFVIIFNWKKKFTWARVLGVLLMNFLAWQAALIYGKSFNGYLMFFPTILYAILALSKQPLYVRIPSSAISILSLLFVDYLSHLKVIPITDLNSGQFSVTVLWIDTLITTGFLSILLLVEKSYYDKYETELQNLNENLEEIVQTRTAMLVAAKEEAVQASMLKSQFVANTSHELRTPVQGLMGFISMAKRRLDKMAINDEANQQLREKVISSLSSADESSERLMNLLNTLLKISKADSAGFKAHPSNFQLDSAIQEALGPLSDKMKLKSMALDLKLSVESEDVFSDKTMVVQVIENLISNAIRYGTEGTAIQLVVGFAENQFEIKIINQGYGVAPEDVERIFDPFVQGSRTDATVGGTGLGLSLCRKYGKAVGGDVQLINPAAECTTFSFRFPQKLAVDQQSAPKSQTA